MLIGRYTAVLDACVLHPAFLQGSLLWLASERLFRPVWSGTILAEWQRSLEKRFGEGSEKILKKRELMVDAFPESMMDAPTQLLDCLTLPDVDDRHVLGTAIVAKADAIITTNVKHFPDDVCRPFDIEVIHPDTFLVNVIDLEQDRALKALQKQRAHMGKSAPTADVFLARFENTGLIQTHERLKPLVEFL